MLVSLFANQLSETPQVPSAVQQVELCRRLSAARALFNWATPISQPNQHGVDYMRGLDQATINTFAEEEAEISRQFLAAASRILNLEQVAAFGQFFERQLQSQVNQMNMSAKMFGSGKP